MGYSITTPTYKSQTKPSVDCEITHNFLKDDANPIIPSIRLIDLINNHLGVAFKSDLRKTMRQSLDNSITKNK
ncbi:unnamed protein product [Linum trigynum]|uniref:Uncharacterized protein n=1 Tax=Linum trigynum TaxID=586398 RepID=A0AAV2FG37_9ROSI